MDGLGKFWFIGRMTKEISISLSDYDRAALKSFMEDQGGVLTEPEAILFVLNDWLESHVYREIHSDGKEYEE